MLKQSIRLLLLCCMLSAASLARSAAPTQEAKEKAPSEEAAVSQPAVYRVEYVVREIEKGKAVNTRSYVLMARSDVKGKAERAAFRVGSRVPILTGTPKAERGNGCGACCAVLRGRHEHRL